MNDDGVVALSKAHVDDYQIKERRRMEELRWQLGSEVVAKLDRRILRDIAYEKRERELAELLHEPAPKPVLHRVIVNLSSGAARSLAAAPMLDRKKRRRAVVELRRSGTRAIERLVPSVTDRGGKVVQTFWLTHSALVELDREQLVSVTDRADVRSVNNDKRHIVLCLDVSRGIIQADVVESNGIDGNGVDVAVLDTGVDFTHAALVAVAGSQQDFTGEGVGDLFGHGSHCAGIVASNDRKFRGVAPGCTIHDYKALDMNGSSTASICISAIQQAVSDGRQVLSNSWGFTHADGAWSCPSGACVLCTAANNAVAAGSVFVVSAGNEDNDTCSTYDTHIGCPGHATDAITIAASDDSDAMAGFSSLGPTADGRAKPDVTAPGVDIISVRATTGSDMGGSATVIDANFVQASGTSMACPHVAGVCALMLERNPTATPAQIKSVLMSTPVNIGATANEMGAGRVDALAAVNTI